MKSLKIHFSVIFPLVVLLSCVFLVRTTYQLIVDYNQKLSHNYSVIVVSSKEINQIQFLKSFYEIDEIERLDPEYILEKFKQDITPKNLELLKDSLPNFYSLKLQNFPTYAEIQSIKSRLLKYDGILKVETFEATYTQLYQLFGALYVVSIVLCSFVFIISLLLIQKQMRIWVLEHYERNSIMLLFGAPFWLRSAVLYRMAFFDSFIAAIIVSIIFSFLPFLNTVRNFEKEIGIKLLEFDLINHGILLFLIGFLLSLVSVSFVVSRKNV